MIVGTAGHIDHGKTTLVRALTGVDTDRLPEEKKRGISIELGYAFLDGADGERVGFVDVPGHERLVHTMLAGATGIDYGLLLVAADDGVMPQTREHLAVLSLLGLARGAVVVTKADRVDAARLAAVSDEIAALVPGSALADAPVFVVSAPSGDGIDALRDHLLAEAARVGRATDPDDFFRLAIDRAFTLDGVGTVVTGTIHRGQVRIGDSVVINPAGLTARVRSLHAQNRAVEVAQAGSRCAVALAGIDRDAVVRGHWLVEPAAVQATDRVDARLTLWQAEARGLRSGTPVQVHVGSTHVPATVAILDVAGDTGVEVLAPGASGRVQLVLRTPVGVWHGDRIVLRDASASRTLAGGVAIDPFAPKRYRRTPQRLAELDALERPGADARLAALLETAANGLDLARYRAGSGRQLPALPAACLRHTDGQHDQALGAGPLARVSAAVRAALAAAHERAPDEVGPDGARLRRLACPRLPEPLWRALLEHLQAQGRIAIRGAFVHLPEHAVRLNATEQRLAEKVAPFLLDARYEGAWARDLARDSGETEPLIRTTLARLARQGALHQVVKDLYYPVATIDALIAIARTVAAASQPAGEITAASFRDATGLGRKRAIQILEYFDRIGWLRRVGDVHRLRTDSVLSTTAAAAPSTVSSEPR